MRDHSVIPMEDALPLREAMRRFVSEDLWRAYESAREARKKLPRRPTFFSSWLHGWEAERANRPAQRAVSAKADVWRAWAAIKRALIEQLIAGDLTAFEQSDPPFGEWRAIPAAAWRSLCIKNAGQGRVTGPNVDLTGVLVVKVDRSVPPVMRTGMEGRPKKGRDIIMAEFERRRASGKTEPKRVREAEWLLAWFQTLHSDKESPTVKTIYNKLPTGYFVPAKR